MTTLTSPLAPISRPADLCAEQQRWAEKRYPRTGLSALFAPKASPTARYDHHAGGLLAAISALLDGTRDRPEGTADNVAALAAYPDLWLVMELLELRLPKDQCPAEYYLPDLAALNHELSGITASLQEFFAVKPLNPVSVELIATYMQQFQMLLFGTPKAGDLWLKTPASQTPIRALPAAMYQYNNCYSHNKVVLGGAGSGRSIMIARLCEIAHEKGNQVVMITFRQSQGTLYQVARRKEGAMRKIATRSQAAFNPFWFPERFIKANNELSEWVLRYLADLLVCLLETATPQLPKLGGSYLPSLITSYYKQQPWQASGASPSFNSFYEFVSSEAANGWGAGLAKPCPTCGAESGCQQPNGKGHNPARNLVTMFLEAGQPFYGTGELAYLMNAEPAQARDLFTPQNSLLYLEMAVGYAGDELQDEVVTQCVSWLVLFGVDMHLGWLSPRQHQGHQFVTVAVDELLDQCLTSTGKTFMKPYLRSKRQNGQELICSWHNQPKYVFSKEHEVAQLIRDSAGCFLLLASGPTWHKEAGLWLSDQQKAQYESLSRNQVLIVGLREFEGVYDVSMSEEERNKLYPRPAAE